MHIESTNQGKEEDMECVQNQPSPKIKSHLDVTIYSNNIHLDRNDIKEDI